uniref:RRM domain-containing protein n=1 Tax=Panagrolaimus sp. JU765 TaxID=591449 RepID=A0AC34QTU2_9BILA
MMTAVGVPGTATLTPQQLAVMTNAGANTNPLIAAAAAAAAGAFNSNGSNASNGTNSSSLCSTPVSLLGQNGTSLQLIQSGIPNFYPTAMSSMTAPYGTLSAAAATSSLSANGLEGLPIFLVPQNGTLPLSALQRQMLAQQHLANTQPKIDTSKHYHVFVGDLSSEVDNNMLKQAFEKYGEISEVKVIRDAQSLKSRGYGFVTYPKKEDAEKAINEMNGQMLGRRAVRTNWATRRTPEDEKKALSYEQIYNASPADNTTVYLGNLNANTTDDKVREAFSKFGPIKEIRMFSSQNYGFVTYETKEAATKAILEMSFEEMDGQMLRCSWGRPAEPNNNNTLNQASLLALSQLAATTANLTPQIPAAAWNPLYPSFYGQNLMPTVWP